MRKFLAGTEWWSLAVERPIEAGTQLTSPSLRAKRSNPVASVTQAGLPRCARNDAVVGQHLDV
jgi:hypothetical protein